MGKTVSIIIPVYNSERYLNRCLDSVLSQRYTHLEVLLIDDGSTDHSLNICREYAAKDNRIRVVHQDNQGASAARNTGLDHATGEYIMFCDSDDMVSDMWVQRMINALSDEETIMPFTGICDGVEQLGTKTKGLRLEGSWRNPNYFKINFTFWSGSMSIQFLRSLSSSVFRTAFGVSRIRRIIMKTYFL